MRPRSFIIVVMNQSKKRTEWLSENHQAKNVQLFRYSNGAKYCTKASLVYIPPELLCLVKAR